MKKLLYIFILSFFINNLQLVATDINQPLKIKTLYGDFEIKEEVIKELISHPMFKRLRFIHQYGIFDYVKSSPKDFSRFDHSIGVFAILRKYNRPLKEQIAGLLHDVSHTVFSHIGDYYFQMEGQKDSYQDKIHEWFLIKSGIEAVLEKHGLKAKDILHKNKEFSALEQSLPDICADRLEYNLRGGLKVGLLRKEDIKAILDDLKFENDKWFFTNPEVAKKFANVPLYHTEHVWTSARSSLLDVLGAKALKRAVKIKLISIWDIHFSLDDVVWKKLKESVDPKINMILNKIINIDSTFRLADKIEEYDKHLDERFRGIDPLIKIDNTLMRLSEVDNDFKKNFLEVKARLDSGWRVIFN